MIVPDCIESTPIRTISTPKCPELGSHTTRNRPNSRWAQPKLQAAATSIAPWGCDSPQKPAHDSVNSAAPNSLMLANQPGLAAASTPQIHRVDRPPPVSHSGRRSRARKPQASGAHPSGARAAPFGSLPSVGRGRYALRALRVRRLVAVWPAAGWPVVPCAAVPCFRWGVRCGALRVRRGLLRRFRGVASAAGGVAACLGPAAALGLVASALLGAARVGLVLSRSCRRVVCAPGCGAPGSCARCALGRVSFCARCAWCSLCPRVCALWGLVLRLLGPRRRASSLPRLWPLGCCRSRFGPGFGRGPPFSTPLED